MRFYKSKRSFDPMKFARNFMNKAFKGIEATIRKVTAGVKAIMRGIRVIINVFKKGFRGTEIQIGSPQEETMIDDVVQSALDDEKKHDEEEMQLAMKRDEEEERVGGLSRMWSFGGVLSVSFSASVSVLVKVNISGGFFTCLGGKGCNVKRDTGTYFGMGIGVKTDISVGIGATVELYNSAAAVSGWAGEFAFGPDLSPSECGVDFYIGHTLSFTYGLQINTIGISGGCGVGISPYDFEWNSAFAWGHFPNCTAEDNELSISGSEDENSVSSPENSEETSTSEEESVSDEPEDESETDETSVSTQPEDSETSVSAEPSEESEEDEVSSSGEDFPEDLSDEASVSEEEPEEGLGDEYVPVPLAKAAGMIPAGEKGIAWWRRRRRRYRRVYRRVRRYVRRRRIRRVVRRVRRYVRRRVRRRYRRYRRVYRRVRRYVRRRRIRRVVRRVRRYVRRRRRVRRR
jgi:hypothetical protein